MTWDPRFGDWVQDHLSGLGPFEIKRMFGGAGALKGGAMFAILSSDTIWLKADDALAAEMAEEGSERFQHGPPDRRRTLPYWSLPSAAMDDPEQALAWARRAVEVALRPERARKRR